MNNWSENLGCALVLIVAMCLFFSDDIVAIIRAIKGQ